MIRPFKALGHVAVVILVIGGVAASAASAAEFHTTAGAEIRGEQIGTNVFTTDGGEVECETATFSGTAAANTSTQQLVAPTYNNCTAFGFEEAVDMNGCEFLFTNTGEVHIVNCNAGEHIELTVLPELGLCTITVFEQSIPNAVIYTNAGGAGNLMDIEVDINAAGITYEVDGGEGNCGAEGTLTHNGTYTGKATVRAFSGGSQVSLTFQ